MLFKAFTSRPLTVESSKPMAIKGDLQRKIAYDWSLAHVPEFRRIHRRVSVLRAITMVAYAIVRVLGIYSVSDIGSGRL